jgi:hypothetical protein
LFSRLNYGSLALRPVALLALLSELTRFASSHRGRLLPGFRWVGHPRHRRISLQCRLGNLHWRDFHPLDHQLASLHYLANLCPLGCYVVNEVRRLADDSLSHGEHPNARQSPEGRHCLLKHAVGMLGMTNFERKRMMAFRSFSRSSFFNIRRYISRYRKLSWRAFVRRCDAPTPTPQDVSNR